MNEGKLPVPYISAPTVAFKLGDPISLPPPKTQFSESLAVHTRRGPFLPFACGHRGPKTFGFRVFGKNFQSTDLPPQDKYCAECQILVHLKPDLVRCAHCAAPILPGQQAILCSSDHRIDKRYARVIGSNVVVCAGEECRSSGACFKGIWKGLEEGFEAVLSDEPISVDTQELRLMVVEES